MSHSSTPKETERLIYSAQCRLDSIGNVLRTALKAGLIADCASVRNIYTCLRNIEYTLVEVSPDPTAVRVLTDVSLYRCMTALTRGPIGKCLLTELEKIVVLADDEAKSVRQSLPECFSKDLADMINVLPAWLRTEVFFK